MAHVRKDTLTQPPQWWKHLKKYKKLVSKTERKAAANLIHKELKEDWNLLHKRHLPRLIEH